MNNRLRFLVFVVLFFSIGIFSVFGESSGVDDRTAFYELQMIAAKKMPYSSEVGDKVSDYVLQLWEKPLYRHKVATLLNMNDGYLDSFLNRSYLDSLDPAEKDLPNFVRVDRKLFRGGQPTEAGYKRLKQLGVKSVINLRLEDPSEEKMVKDLGFRYFYLPIPDTNAPTAQQISDFMKIMNDRNNGKVYIHCAAGVNRTGTMTALWRISTGMSNSEAFDEAKKYGFNENRLECDRPAALIRTYQKK